MKNRGFTAFRRSYLPVLLIIALAVAVRLIYLTLYSQMPDWEMLTVDNWYHFNWAKSIADGNILGDTTYFRAPFYTWCIGSLFAVFGATLWVARLFGLLIGASSVFVTYLLGEKIFGKKAGGIAALLHCFYPALIYFESELLLDPLFTLIVELAMYRLLIWLESNKPIDLFWCGFVCSVGAITRPTMLIIAPLILAFVLLDPRVRGKLVQSILFLIGLSICVAPVFIRNVVVAHDPVLISSQAGINLYIGNNDSADGFSASMPEPYGHNWSIQQVTHIAEEAEGRDLKPGEVSTYWSKRAINWIADNPVAFTCLYLKKLGLQFVSREVSNNRALRPFFDSHPMLRYNPLSLGIVIALAVVGVLTGASWRDRRTHKFILIFFPLYMLAISFFFFNSRFRLPLLPLHMILASGGLLSLAAVFRISKFRFVGLLVIASLVALFSYFPPFGQPLKTSPQSVMSRGLHLYSLQQYDSAQQTFRYALEIDNEFPETNLNLGACFFRKGQEDSARYYFERELTLHPLRFKTYNNLASLDLVNDDYVSAKHWIETAVRIAPYNETANMILLRCLAADTAISSDSLSGSAWSIVEATGNNLFVLNEAARQLSRRCNPDTIEEFLLAALVSQPPPIETDDLAFGPNFKHDRNSFDIERAQTYFLLGFNSGVQGKPEQAVQHSRKAIDLDSSLAEAYVNLASGLLGINQQAEADSVIGEALNRFPDHSQIRALKPYP